MKSLTLLGLLLLAGTIYGGPTSTAPPDSTRGVYVDRHVDAHVPAREGEPATSPTDDRERRSASDPAQGASVIQPAPPVPPAIHYYRDPLFRERRF